MLFLLNFGFFVLQYDSLKSFIVGYITSSLNHITSNFDSEDKSKILIFFLQNSSSNFNFHFLFERKAMLARPELCPGVNGTTIVAVEFAVIDYKIEMFQLYIFKFILILIFKKPPVSSLLTPRLRSVNRQLLRGHEKVFFILIFIYLFFNLCFFFLS